jgi:hypothetical protein
LDGRASKPSPEDAMSIKAVAIAEDAIAEYEQFQKEKCVADFHGDDIHQTIVCLRHGDGKEAAGQLKAIYADDLGEERRA